jgi:hypothetical protein
LAFATASWYALEFLTALKVNRRPPPMQQPHVASRERHPTGTNHFQLRDHHPPCGIV